MLVSLNISNDQWEIIEDSEEINEFLIKFGVKDDNFPPIVFDNLSFGCKLTHEKFLVWEIVYPERGTKYISTDQEYLESFSIYIDYETEYKLTFWVTNNSIYYETSYILNPVSTPNELISDFDNEIEGVFNGYS